MRRATVEVKWFMNCATLEEAKALYKVLVMQHHPDRGGSLQNMQEINVEYDMIKKDPSRLYAKQNEPFSAGSWTYRDAQSRRNRYDTSNWKTYTDDDFKIKPGRYTCVVTRIQENAEKQYVALVFDIAEGKHKNHFQFEPWYRHCIYLSYKTDWQLEKAKKIISVFNASNPGFDGHSAFCDDKAYKFIGMRINITIDQQYIDGEGFINPSQVHKI